MGKNETIKALINFKDAYYHLLANFDLLNETDAIKLYPFEKSFDEYNIIDWVLTTVKELEGK